MEVTLNLVWLLVAVVALVAWRSRWLGPRQRWVDTFCRTLLVFWALAALSAGCLASETPSSSAPQLPTSRPLWEHGGTIADLDGDSRLDLAIVRPEGWGPKGFQYRIELDLTSLLAPSSFSVFAEEGGLRVVPRDADGDGDLDLVITTARSLAPVGVWINDGHGGFTEGHPTAYPRSVWTEDPEVSPDTPQETLEAAVPQSYRSWLDVSRGSHFYTELLFDHLFLFLAAANPPRVAASRLQTRSPPQSLPQQPS